MLFKTLKNRDFKEAYSSGKRINGKFFTIVVLSAEEILWGISISKKHGNAVARNKLRRRIKEIVGFVGAKLSTGAKVVVVPRIGATEAVYSDARDDLLLVLRKAHLVG